MILVKTRMKFYFVRLLLLKLLITATIVAAFEGDFTINVESGEEECFYQAVVQDELLEVEYQVIDGDRDDLFIDFRLYSSTGAQIVYVDRKSEGQERHKMTESGDIKICFENDGGSKKVVYFEVFVDTPSDGTEDEDPDWAEDGVLATGAVPEEQYEVTVDDIQNVVNKVRVNLAKINSFQTTFRSTEARDRNIQERNFSYVNNWSLFQLSVMMVVGIIQVITVRSLFDEKSRLHKLWKKF